MIKSSNKSLFFRFIKRIHLFIPIIVFYCFSPNYAYSQFTQQGSKIVGTGGDANSDQGISVAISSDGNTAIVGGYQDNSGKGAAWVFTRSGGVWSQQGSKLVGTGAVGTYIYQGCAVDISADGNTAIVGGYGDNSGKGAAWVFTRSGGVWTQQGSKLVGTGAVGASNQGSSVSLSDDGNTAIIGGQYDNGNVGALWVFTRSGGVWSQQGSKLVGTGGSSPSYQGASACLSADGNTAVIGGWYDNNTVGAAWVFTRSGGVWSQQGSKLVGTGAVGDAWQGASVAVSPDGNTVIVGGYGDNNWAGAAWVYTRSGGVWSQQGSKLVGTGGSSNASQGSAVALSYSGDTAVIGAYFDNSAVGAVWVFTRSGGVWSQMGNKLVGTGWVNHPEQGQSAAISYNGQTIIEGGWTDNNNAGAAWVFYSSSPCTNPTVPTLSTTVNPVCTGDSTILSIASGSLNSATAWQWYSNSCGGTSIGMGTYVSVSPSVATTYYVRGEGGCVTPGSCGNITINVNPPPAQYNVTGGGAYCSESTGVNINLSGSQSGVDYQLLYSGSPLWSPVAGTGTGLSFGTQIQAGTYSVEATDTTTACKSLMAGTAAVSIYNCPLSYKSVSINTEGAPADTSAIFDVKDTISGVLFPRLNNTQRDNLNYPDTGLIIYNTSTNKFNYFFGGNWYEISAGVPSGGPGSTAVNYGTAINSTGATSAPSAILDVSSTAKGVLIPGTLPGAIYGAAEGSIIYNIYTNTINYYNGLTWLPLTANLIPGTYGTGYQAQSGCGVNATGAAPATSAILDIKAQNKALLIPRMTTVQRNRINPATGLLIYNTTTGILEYFNGAGWCELQ